MDFDLGLVVDELEEGGPREEEGERERLREVGELVCACDCVIVGSSSVSIVVSAPADDDTAVGTGVGG